MMTLDLDDRIQDASLGMAIPRSGYLADWVEYGCQVSMAPPEFHLACGLVQMAAMLGNRAVFPLGAVQYPVHVWFILLGPAGSKKSSAVRLAMAALDEATPETLRLPQESSPEQLRETLAKRPTGYMAMSEFLSFLAKATRRDWMAGIREDLCEIFDSPERMERSLRSGTTIIRRPAVTIIGAAVADALGDWVRQQDLAQGFLSRFLFIPQTTEIHYRGMSEVFAGGRQSLVEVLREIGRNLPIASDRSPIRVKFPEASRKLWEEYDQEMLKLNVPGELAGFQGRLGLYTAKLAICYALAGTGSVIPQPEHVDLAVAFVEYGRQQVWRLTEELDSSRDAQDLRRLRDTLRHLGNGDSDGWVRVRDVMRRMHVLRRRLMELLDALAGQERIEYGESRTKVRLLTKAQGVTFQEVTPRDKP